MATDQEILKARTFRVEQTLRGAADSAEDADIYHKMRMLNAYRYVHGSLEPVLLFPPREKDGLEYLTDWERLEYLTPWEREWSALARSYVGGFSPIVDEKGTIIAHRGVTEPATNLIAPLEDLLYTLPQQTVGEIRVGLTLKKNSDFKVGFKSLLELLKDGANIFVHGRKKELPPDWRRLEYIPWETKLTLIVSVDGQLFDFAQENTGFLKEGYSPMDFVTVGRIMTLLGAAIGKRLIRVLVRKAIEKAEARLLLAGPTAELAKAARARIGGKPHESLDRWFARDLPHGGRLHMSRGEVSQGGLIRTINRNRRAGKKQIVLSGTHGGKTWPPANVPLKPGQVRRSMKGQMDWQESVPGDLQPDGRDFLREDILEIGRNGHSGIQIVDVTRMSEKELRNVLTSGHDVYAGWCESACSAAMQRAFEAVTPGRGVARR